MSLKSRKMFAVEVEVNGHETVSEFSSESRAESVYREWCSAARSRLKTLGQVLTVRLCAAGGTILEYCPAPMTPYAA